ncbi:MAG: hypothetical protein OXG64_04055 [Chloroflexi bacterium]|nr:hypothetical protein [Chloroflexota bacterium]
MTPLARLIVMAVVFCAVSAVLIPRELLGYVLIVMIAGVAFIACVGYRGDRERRD